MLTLIFDAMPFSPPFYLIFSPLPYAAAVSPFMLMQRYMQRVIFRRAA